MPSTAQPLAPPHPDFAFHLPLYFISKVRLFWPLILLQTSGLPVLVYPKCDHCGSGARGRRYAVFCVEGFVIGLDGVGGGFGAYVHATMSPFNLVRSGY